MPHTSVDYQVVFAKIPGNNVLFLADSPHFSIIEISDDYAKLLPKAVADAGVKTMNELLQHLHIADVAEFRDRLRESFEAAISSNKPHVIDRVLLHMPAKGPGAVRITPVSIRNIPVASEGGEVEYVIHTISESTEPVVETNDSDAHLKNLVEYAPQPMAWLMGQDFILKAANRPMLKIWQLDESVIGRPVSESLRELHQQAGYKEVLQQVYETGEPYHSAETLHVAPLDGQSKAFYLDITCTGIREADGTISGILVIANDVTEQIRLRDLVLDSEKHFRNMIAQAPVAIGVVKGSEMLIESANAPMLELWGKSPDVVGKTLLEGLPEVRYQQFPELLMEVYTTGKAYRGFETRAYLVVDGLMEERYFNFIYAPITDERSQISGVMMIANDVTVQVNAKLDLQASEKKFRDLVAQAPVATAVYIGSDMVIQLANEAMLKLWGKDHTAIGKSLSEALPELAGQPFLPLLHNVFTSGVSYRATEDRADLVVDGKLQTFFFNFTYKALRNANGEIYGILNMAVDVTEQVLSRKKIVEGEEKLRLAVDVTEMGTFSFDMITGDVEYSARTAEILTGSQITTLSREALLKCMHPEDRWIRDEAFETAYKTGVLDYELRIICPNESVHWIKVRGKMIFEQERPTHLYGTVLDITESKQVEEELERRVEQRTRELQQANKEMQYSNQELEQYAYVASHDLQEPLRKIITYGSLLREKSASSMDDAARSRLDKIMASAARMSNLINDLLNFSRLLKEEHHFAVTDLNTVLDNVINDFELTVEEKKAVIHKGGLPKIEASPQQMNQLFYNLLSNALKFSQAERQPVISFASRLLTKEEIPQLTDLDAGHHYYDITVSDNGIGFSKAHSEQIFEIFKRLHTREIYPGSGIGLALCRKIAMNHQGDIFAESEEGVGTTFHILLPSKQKHTIPEQA